MVGTVKALEGYHDRVVVITPQPISATTFISVSFQKIETIIDMNNINQRKKM